MKKLSIIILILIITTSLISGCKKSDDTLHILKKVEAAEILNARFSFAHDISFDDCISQFKELCVKDYDISELEASREDYERYVKEEKEYKEKNGVSAFDLDMVIELSTVYQSDNKVYIFTKSEVNKNDNTLKPQINIKKYILVKENDDWRIIGVDTHWFEKDAKHASYPTYDNKPIDYIKIMKPFKK
ncbi:hypothetical protein PV797_21075 [Clostridiaceae bacterium M8S5]|nr:hypothetical protein PV797_21075 [Clostridiaceae bacterium M8S5]